MNQMALTATDLDLPESEVKSLRDHLHGFSHRIGVFITTALVLTLVTVIVTIVWPPTYRSYATILIEQQEIPENLVRSTITSFAAQRIQVISQRVMTRSNLEPLIEKYDLYKEDRADEPLEVVLEMMRGSIHVDPISASVIDPRSGQPTTATIAFSVAFTYESAEIAQKIANELVSLYLNENIKNRNKLATEASGFLKDEADKVSARINELEGRLATFKEKNYSLLPEMNTVNFQLLDRVERELEDVRRVLKQTTEQRSFLEAQRTQMEAMEANNSMLVDGQRVPSPRERLDALQRRLSAMSAVYSVEHPDMMRTKREIAVLERELAAQPAPLPETIPETNPTEQPDIAALEARYEARHLDHVRARERYSSSHPDVLRLEREVNTLLAELAVARKQAAARTGNSSTESRDVFTTGPALLQLQAQIKNNDLEQYSLSLKRVELETKVKEYERRLGDAPAVEREFHELERERQNAWVKYGELKVKQTEAQLAESLESERKGERFTLIEPPQAPVRPVTPNRPLVLVVGLLFTVLLSAGLVLLLEAIDETVRGSKDLVLLTGMAPLSRIPYIVTLSETRAKWWRAGTAMASVVVVITGAVWAAHVFWMPLDVIIYSGLRRFGFSF